MSESGDAKRWFLTYLQMAKIDDLNECHRLPITAFHRKSSKVDDLAL